MKKILLPALLALFVLTQCNSSTNDKSSDNAVGSDAKKEVDNIKKIDYYGQKQILNDVIKAEFEANRIPIVYFWASWCGPCKEFKSSLSDPLMQDALNNVTLIMIDTDIDDVKEMNNSEYGVSGIPAFVKVDKDGAFIDLVDGGAWDANIPANMAPVLKAFIAGNSEMALTN